jgi:biofilm PGA synthesis lipoprotein PgaB
LFKETGHRPRAIVWPYGAYNQIAVRIAAEEGMPISFSLGDALPDVQTDTTIPRLLVSGNISANRLGWVIRHQQRIDAVRAVQVDLDYVYDPDPKQQERNLSILLDRIKRMHPSQVWLQAYADPKGDGVAEAAYFPSRHLPMRADLFSRVEWQLRTRAFVRVYAWMPVMAFRFPDAPNLPSLARRTQARWRSLSSGAMGSARASVDRRYLRRSGDACRRGGDSVLRRCLHPRYRQSRSVVGVQSCADARRR